MLHSTMEGLVGGRRAGRKQWKLKRKYRARERVQWAKELAAKPKELSSILRTHMVRKEPTVIL